jgi:ribonuclease J
LALVRQKLEDRGTGVKGVTLIDVSDGERKTAGCFEVEFIHVNHSIADANALAIRTPAGTIFYSGDFKIDYTPINGTPMDLSRIAEIGAEGVLLMVCESTNIERTGHSSSESKVGETLIELFQQAPGRIFVTTFSSNVFRIQQIITAAERYQRKVVLIGRSMLNYFAAADSLGYLTYKMDTLIDVNQVGKFDSDQLVFITTGSQGEPLSALTRMAYAEHRQIEIVPGDTVILSSSAIPGNEKPIYRVINELYKRGARVIYESLSEIHVSGHGYQEELKILHNLVHPRYFIPGHGEYRHLYRHAELANQLGISFENIFILNNGDIFEFQPQKNSALISGFVQAPGVLIDGSGIGDIDQLVLRDRLLLAEDGVIAVAIAINRQTGEMNGMPSIQARGFIYESESTRIVKDCQKKIADMARKAALSDRSLSDLLRSDAISDQLQQLLYSRTKRRPMILISVIDI